MTNELIKKFEGFRPSPYLDEAGISTIGYGSITYPDGVRVTMRDHEISEEQASEFLEHYVKNEIAPIMRSKIHVITQLNFNQKEAVKSLIYNIGPGAFSRSTVLRKINSGDFNAAADAFLLWNKVTVNGKKKISNGLRIRRESERELFLQFPYKPSSDNEVEKKK